MMTGAGSWPVAASACPSAGWEELEVGPDAVLLLLLLLLLPRLLSNGGPLEAFCGESDWELVLLLFGGMLLLPPAMFPPALPLAWYGPLKEGWLFRVPWKGRQLGEQEGGPPGPPGPASGRFDPAEDPGGNGGKPPMGLVLGLGSGDSGVGGVWLEDW